MKAKLIRLMQDDKQTLSSLLFFNDDIKLMLHVKALELPDRNNATAISRINAGKYICKLRYSLKFGWHFIVENVEGRSYILIHFGNTYKHTNGCILVGNAFTDLDGDGYRDVTSSKKTLKRILAIAPKQFELLIINE